MTLRETAHILIDRIPDNDFADEAIKRICAIAKKAGKETRCAPKRSKCDRYPHDLMEETVNVTVRKSMIR